MKPFRLIMRVLGNPLSSMFITTLLYAYLLVAFPALGKTLITVVIAFIAGNLVVKLFAHKDKAGIFFFTTKQKGLIYLIYFMTIIAATIVSELIVGDTVTNYFSEGLTTPRNAFLAGLFFSVLVFVELHFR